MDNNKPKNIIKSPTLSAVADARIITPDKTIDLTGAVGLEIVLELRDKNGNLKERRVEQGHSFLANFIKLLFCSAMVHHAPMCDGSVLTLTDTGGTARTGDSDNALLSNSGGISNRFMRANAGIGVDTWGILVGTDDGTLLAKDINNYALGAKIAHGTGSGQLSHGDHSIVPVTHDGATYSYAGITRTFSNGSGASIGINEFGLATMCNWDSGATRYFLLSRDILGTTVTVPNGETLTVSVRVKCFC